MLGCFHIHCKHNSPTAVAGAGQYVLIMVRLMALKYKDIALSICSHLHNKEVLTYTVRRHSSTVGFFSSTHGTNQSEIYQSCPSAFSLLPAKVDGPSLLANLFGILHLSPNLDPSLLTISLKHPTSVKC